MISSNLRIAFLGMILLSYSALAEDPKPCGECTGDLKIGGNLEVPGSLKTGGELSIGGPVRADGFVGPKLSVKEAYIEDSIDAREGVFESLTVDGDLNIGDELGADKAVFNFVSISKLLDAANGTFDDLTVRNKLDASEISVSRDLEVRGSFGITRDNVLEVDLRGGHDYRTLQEALNAIPDSGAGAPSAYNT